MQQRVLDANFLLLHNSSNKKKKWSDNKGRSFEADLKNNNNTFWINKAQKEKIKTDFYKSAMNTS